MKNFYVGIGFLFSTSVAQLAAFDSASFSPHVDFPAGSGQVGLAFGDLDGDGKPDAVAANYSSGSISVYRNTGTGGVVDSSTFAGRVDFAVGATPVLVRLADLDGDGRLDIICVNQGSDSISLLRNTATNGVINETSFAPKLDLTTTSDPRWVTVADLDGDGKLDLASATYTSGKLSLFQNHSTPGTLNFAARADITPSSSAPTIEAGDIDGDGHPDLVITYAATPALSVYRNIHGGGAIGAGSFAAPVDFATGNGASLTLADLDGDGKLDVLTQNASDDTLSVFRNNATPGEITATSLAARVSFATGSYPYAAAITDLDGDGKPDVAVADAGSHTVSIFRNVSAVGSFTTTSLLARVVYLTGGGPRVITTADVDGDGLPDLATPNLNQAAFSVLRNTGTNGVPPVIPPTVQSDFNLARDFSATVNPAGVWAYGWKGALGGAFTTDPIHFNATSDNGVPVAGWAANSTHGLPAHYCNTSGSTAIIGGGQGILPPGTFWMHPGANGRPENFGAVRFTAPSNSNYRVETRADSLYNGYFSGDTDYHVVVNGVEVFGQPLPATQGTGWTNTLSLSAGDTIDLALGRGADGNGWGAGLKIVALITPTTNDGVVITNQPPVITNEPPAVAHSDFNAGRDFLAAVNPSGAWSYGWKANLDAGFTLHPIHFGASSDNGVAVSGWAANSTIGLPALYCNTSPTTAIIGGGQGVLPPGTMWFHPGANGQPENFGALRFTAPSNANYRLVTVVNSLYTGSYSGDTDFHVIVNGIEIFGQGLPATTGTSFSNVVALAAGDTVDFALGRGADGDGYGAGLKISAILTATTDGAMVITNESSIFPPVLVSQPPAFLSRNAGSTVALNVAASGTAPLSYQWLFNGAAISGAAGASLVFSNVQPAQAGLYRIIVSNSAGSVTNAGTTLHVNVTTGGTVNFANLSTNRVYDVGGSNLVQAGGSLVAGLFHETNSGNFVQIGSAAPFIISGRFNGGTRYLPGTAAGQSVPLQVRVWDSAFGASFDAAAAGRRGVSVTFNVTLGGGIQPPDSLRIMPGFALNLPGQAAAPVKAAVNLPLTLRHLTRTANGWGLMLTGRAGTTYAIETSTSLAQWKTAAYVVAGESGTAEFMHQDAGAKCFYRAKLVNQ